MERYSITVDTGYSTAAGRGPHRRYVYTIVYTEALYSVQVIVDKFVRL
jgi:hypothetical protein